MKTAAELNVMIMAGGTGGHVFPAMAVAENLRSKGASLAWMGTARGIESRLVPQANIKLHLLRVEGVRGRGIIGLLKAPTLISLAILQALTILRRERPDVVLGFGGFASGPGGMAASILNIPLVIHEQNAIPGTTNRLLARIANRVLAAFPGAFPKAQIVGNPVRESIVALPSPKERYSQRTAEKTNLHVLILGGSLGANAINHLLPKAMALVDPAARPSIWHQTGRQHEEATLALYAQHQVDARVEAFIEDMAAAYAWADLIICRAGALTVSEIMAAGVAAVFIPLPTAIDDHQTHNAAILVNAGAALSYAQDELTPASLAALFSTNLHERETLTTMAEKARQLAMPCAADSVAKYCVEVARG